MWTGQSVLVTVGVSSWISVPIEYYNHAAPLGGQDFCCALPPRTGTVACISLDIRFICIKLSQIFTVTYVLRYGEAKFVVSKKKEILDNNLGLGQIPTPPPIGTLSQIFPFF